MTPALRLSGAFACLTVSILCVAHTLGFFPDRIGAALNRRKAICEALAIHCSLAAQRNDQAAIDIYTKALAVRNPDIAYAVVRLDNGDTLAEIGSQDARRGDGSTGSVARVPISLGGNPWGVVEVWFPPLVSQQGLLAPLSDPHVRLIVFIASSSALAFLLFSMRLFRRLSSVSGGQAVPDRVRDTLNTFAEGVLVMDRDERIAYANDAFSLLTEKTLEQLHGLRVSDIGWTAPDQEGEVEEFPWQKSVAEGERQTGGLLELAINEKDQRTVSVNSTPIRSDDGEVRGTLATFDDLSPIQRKNQLLAKLLRKLKESRTKVRQQNEELKVLATRDALTGCLNRRSFLAECSAMWSAAQRYRHPLSCVMLDIDHFKAVNDTHGHAKGDDVLGKVAATLHHLVRDSDRVCRYGGEEFCILMPYIDLPAARQAAKRFCESIASSKIAGLLVTASFGVSAQSLGAENVSHLLEQADQALYGAKHNGRNQVVSWDELETVERAASATAAAPTANAMPEQPEPASAAE